MNTLNGIFSTPKPPLKNYLIENRKKIRQMSSKSVRSETASKQKLSPPSALHKSSKPNPGKDVADGVEFPRLRPQLFVQCRNQSSQTGEEAPIGGSTRYPSPHVLPEDSNEVGDTEQSPKELGIEIVNSPKVNGGTEELNKSSKGTSIRSTATSKKRSSKVRSWKAKKDPVPVIDPDCPPGHVQLSEIERLDMLEKLKDSYECNLQELNRLPVRADTLRIRTKKIELDKKLDQIEAGIKLFSKSKVYVKLEENDEENAKVDKSM